MTDGLPGRGAERIKAFVLLGEVGEHFAGGCGVEYRRPVCAAKRDLERDQLRKSTKHWELIGWQPGSGKVERAEIGEVPDPSYVGHLDRAVRSQVTVAVGQVLERS